MNTLSLPLIAFVFFGCEPQLFAQTSAPITSMSDPAVPAETLATPVPVPAKVEMQPEWSGDLRYRFLQTKESTDQARPYQQLRARLQAKTDVGSDLKAVLRLATASSAISANQTLGDSTDPGFARRSFGLDIAMMTWSAAPGLQLNLGRVSNPYFAAAKNQLIFDSDLNFEGLSVMYKNSWGPAEFFVNAGAFIVAENYDSTTKSDVVDIGLPGFQLGYHQTFSGVELTAHYANQNYVNIQDAAITNLQFGAKFDSPSQPFNRYRGNSIYAVDTSVPLAARKFQMANKYVIDIFGLEMKSKVSVVDLTAFAEFAKNREVSADGSGYEYGLTAKWGRTQIGIAKIRKEADALVAAFTDSDANGGGTDGDGQRVSLGYQFSKNSAWALHQYNAKRGISSVERDFSLTQVDFMLNF